MTKLSKGVCSYCNININLGQLVLDCVNCNANIHAKCCKRAGYVIVDNNWTCNFCTSQHTTRYNPFKIICDDDDHSSNIPHDTIHSLQNITTILKSCRSYDKEEFNKIVYTLRNLKSHSYLHTFIISMGTRLISMHLLQNFTK